MSEHDDRGTEPAEQRPPHHPDDEIIEEEVEQQRSNIPVVTMVVSLVILAVTVGVIAWFVSTAGDDSPEPVGTPSVQPTGRPELPAAVGEYQRAPGGGHDVGDQTELLTASSIYVRNGQEALLVVAVRPSSDAREILEQIEARAIVDHDDSARCGLDQNDLDICAVPYGNTVVLVEGLRDQSVDDLVTLAREIAPQVG